jgi:GTP-binding protein
MKNFNKTKITSAKFLRGIVDVCPELESDIPQVALIGRSNAGKSSVINSLTKQKGLAKTSSFPGRTQEINLFLINNSRYLLDLPGYGFAKASMQARERLHNLIDWYLFMAGYEQRLVVLIVDAKIGPQENDLEILRSLDKYKKQVIIVANKVDKLGKTEYVRQMQKIQTMVGKHIIIPYSSKEKIGVGKLISEILNA